MVSLIEYESSFEQKMMLVATAYHPRFKTHFSDEEYKDLAKRYLLEEVQKVTVLPAAHAQPRESKGDFFAKWPRRIDTAEQELNRFLADESEDLESIHAYHRV